MLPRLTKQREEGRRTRREEYALERDAELALEEPRAALRERLARELRLVAHLDAVARDEQREDRDRLRLGEAAPDAAARAAGEGQEAVARVVLEEALWLEGVGVVPVLGCGGGVSFGMYARG